VGCSELWPERKVEAEGVRISRIEMWAWVERAERIWIFMLATEPEVQRRWGVFFVVVGVVLAGKELGGWDEDGGWGRSWSWSTIQSILNLLIAELQC
jgi:hypothetical protein